MMYLTGAVPPAARRALDDGLIGFITTPNIGNRRDPGWTWAADSGCFNSATYRGDATYLAWLAAQHSRERCLFATAPDVVGDHDATLARSLPLIPAIRALGYRVAFVLQDGATAGTVPWESLDVLFVGGTDAFKLGRDAESLIREASRRGVPVHVGRVNSRRRYLRFRELGCASCDGTYLAFGPDANMPRLLGWLADAQAPLWRLAPLEAG